VLLDSGIGQHGAPHPTQSQPAQLQQQQRQKKKMLLDDDD
jgi:hypothetical protein